MLIYHLASHFLLPETFFWWLLCYLCTDGHVEKIESLLVSRLQTGVSGSKFLCMWQSFALLPPNGHSVFGRTMKSRCNIPLLAALLNVTNPLLADVCRSESWTSLAFFFLSFLSCFKDRLTVSAKTPQQLYLHFWQALPFKKFLSLLSPCIGDFPPPHPGCSGQVPGWGVCKAWLHEVCSMCCVMASFSRLFS